VECGSGRRCTTARRRPLSTFTYPLHLSPNLRPRQGLLRFDDVRALRSRIEFSMRQCSQICFAHVLSSLSEPFGVRLRRANRMVPPETAWAAWIVMTPGHSGCRYRLDALKESKTHGKAYHGLHATVTRRHSGASESRRRALPPEGAARGLPAASPAGRSFAARALFQGRVPGRSSHFPPRDRLWRGLRTATCDRD
jgi:hypothetical protein